jgi:hypothetical protein
MSSVSADTFPRRLNEYDCQCDALNDNHVSLTQVIQLKTIRPDAPSDFQVTITNIGPIEMYKH